MALDIKTNFNENDKSWEIKLDGDLDIYTSSEFKEKLMAYFKENKTDIVIDAENLEYIDSTGLGVLISILKEVKDEEKDIYIDKAKSNVRKIFDITELDKLFIFRGESDE